MICTYLNEANQDCAQTDIDSDVARDNSPGTWTLFSSLLTDNSPYLTLTMLAPLAASYAHGVLWTAVQWVLSRGLLTDPEWVRHAVLPCLGTLLSTLLPVWLLAGLMRLLG